MRLAAEYQQRNKKQEQKQESGRRYIVRLGKGLPNQQKRKRGISISQANSNISQQSLGKNEVSRQKQREQMLVNQKQTFINRKPTQEKVLASVATYTNHPQKLNGYAAEHLLDVKPKELETVASTTKYLSGVKSQQNLINRQNNHLIGERNASKIVPSHISNGGYISPKIIPLHQPRPISRQHGNLVQINSKIIEYPSNLRIYEAKPIQNQQTQLFRSNPASKQMAPQPKITQIKMKLGEPIKVNMIKQYKSEEKNIANSRRCFDVKEELIQTTRNTQRLISSQNKNDPYNLSSLKLTKKNEDYEKAPEELKQTKKYLKGVPECKQISSSNASSDSKSNALFSRTGMISLWDANKVESILSMKSSRQIKVQQSQIMLDYFNPTESMLKKI